MISGIIIGLLFMIIVILLLGTIRWIGEIDDRLKEIERKMQK